MNDEIQARKQAATMSFQSSMNEQTYLHLKASKEFKDRKEVLSKALIRELIQQLNNNHGTIQDVFVKENGREALVRFTYKDSAKRVLAAHTRAESFKDIRCAMATQETIKSFAIEQQA